MELKKVISSRQSIRVFKDKQISDEIIYKIIDAARKAPSGNNSQPSRYFIVKDQKTKDKLKEIGAIHDTWAYKAPVIIICCSEPKYKKFVEGWDSPDEIRALRDVSIASSYLVLRARDLGLGSCYLGWIKPDKIKKVLKIPKDYVIPFVIALGYPKITPADRGRKDIKDIILNPKSIKL
jgi:nitroreductase